jgi:hypothetical protein
MFRNDFRFRATKAVLPVAMLCVLSLSLEARAQEFGYISQQPAMTYTSSVPSYTPAMAAPVTYASPDVISSQPVYHSTSNHQLGLAQSKAARAAQMGLRGHLGGGLGGAKYEGVGWSNQSPQQAIEHCCYWGTRPTAQIGVSKGRDGCWYACVLYH